MDISTSIIKKDPVVSVVVITYNRKELLTETLHSILNQTYQDFEVIVVDNHSDYDFFGLIKSFNSDKLIGYQIFNNGVIAKSRNLGISKAKGKYLAFCDDDDIWLPEKLEKQVNLMESGKYDLISSSIYLFGENIKGKIFYEHSYKSSFEPYLYNKLTPSTVITLNREEVHFNESPEVNCMEDWTMWITLMFIEKYRLFQIKEALVMYRVFPHNLSKSNKNKGAKAVRILWSLYKSSPQSFRLDYIVKALAFHSIRAFFIKIGLFKSLTSLKHRLKGDGYKHVM